ncbi:MAG: HEAT repeat domain-containing protein [Planctomycetes bacterium]|nr:HEAT repeat domain-containing protein [Planctomycetota bacterium]
MSDNIRWVQCQGQELIDLILEEALAHEGSLRGSTLLAMETICDEGLAFSREEIAENAISIYANSSNDLATNITSIQVYLRNAEATESIAKAIQISESEYPSPPVLAAAISALGDLGDRSHLPSLLKFINSDNPLIKNSAFKAHARIRKKR